MLNIFFVFNNWRKAVDKKTTAIIIFKLTAESSRRYHDQIAN
jgi:hypothetical protein